MSSVVCSGMLRQGLALLPMSTGSPQGVVVLARAFAEIAFTPSVLAAQAVNGSHSAYARLLQPETGRGDRLGEIEAAFISLRDGFYQASVSETGWPYVQFRGGPCGFLKVLDATRIAYADYRGNRQYLSAGNIASDGRVALILMDYPNRRRLKIWGRASLVEAAQDPGLLTRLMPREYPARPERAVVIDVEAFDWNCPAHIPERFTLEELETVIAPVREEMETLRAENDRLKREVARLSSDVEGCG